MSSTAPVRGRGFIGRSRRCTRAAVRRGYRRCAWCGATIHRQQRPFRKLVGSEQPANDAYRALEEIYVVPCTRRRQWKAGVVCLRLLLMMRGRVVSIGTAYSWGRAGGQIDRLGGVGYRRLRGGRRRRCRRRGTSGPCRKLYRVEVLRLAERPRHGEVHADPRRRRVHLRYQAGDEERVESVYDRLAGLAEVLLAASSNW
jgi:hypothetical protein